MELRGKVATLGLVEVVDVIRTLRMKGAELTLRLKSTAWGFGVVAGAEFGGVCFGAARDWPPFAKDRPPPKSPLRGSELRDYMRLYRMQLVDLVFDDLQP